jgi:hypothetical protein
MWEESVREEKNKREPFLVETRPRNLPTFILQCALDAQSLQPPAGSLDTGQ